MNGKDKQAHYQIIEERGKGIFGAFFRATDLKNQQDISLHVLYPRLTAEPGLMGMLQDAAQTVKGLDHPNLVPVLGFDPNFLQGVTLLQRMPGGSLADLLNTRQRPDPTRAEAMIMQLSTAMAYLHRNQIVLHGLHPSAIHFDELGVARLANVVVAKLLSMAGADDMLPMRQSLASSPYCAPELRQGGKGTYSTDIYSLGIIFYEILRGVSIEAQAEPALGLGEDWLQGIEARWQPVLWQCLLPDPQDRFQNAEALFEAIKSAAGQRQAQGFKPASMFKPDGSARPFFRPLGAGQAPGQVVRSSEGATPSIVAQPSSGAKQAGQEPVAGGVASSVPLQGQAMDTSWQGQVRAHQPLAQGGRETGQDSSVPGQGMEATRQDELRHEREVVRLAPDAARTGRKAGAQMPVSSYEVARSETKQAIQLSKPSIGITRSVLEARRKKVNRRFWALLIGLITILVILFLLLIVWSKGRKNPHQENDNNPPPTVKDIGKENVPLFIEATSTFDQRHYVSTPDPLFIPTGETMPTSPSLDELNTEETDEVDEQGQGSEGHSEENQGEDSGYPLEENQDKPHEDDPSEQPTERTFQDTLNDLYPIKDLSASRNGQIIALCTENEFHVFLNKTPFTILNDMASGSCKKVAVSKDGSHIAFFDAFNSVWIWEIIENFPGESLGITGDVRAIEWIADNYLVIASEHDTSHIIRVFYKRYANQSRWITNSYKAMPIINVNYSRLRFLWSKNPDQLWVTDGSELWSDQHPANHEWPFVENEHYSAQDYTAIDALEDGVITYSQDGKLVYYPGDSEVKESYKFFELPERSSRLTAIASSPDESKIAVGDDQGNLFILNLSQDNRMLMPSDTYTGNKVDKLFWIGDGREVLVLLDNGRVRLHQLP